MEKHYIQYSIVTDASHWTDRIDTIPAAFFDRLAIGIIDYARASWPEIEFSTRLVPEDRSIGNRSQSNLRPEVAEVIVDYINSWIDSIWPDWLGEAIANERK